MSLRTRQRLDVHMPRRQHTRHVAQRRPRQLWCAPLGVLLDLTVASMPREPVRVRLQRERASEQ
eukprot:6081428-Prymnesium_polylepis.1